MAIISAFNLSTAVRRNVVLRLRESFRRFAREAAMVMGSSIAFFLAVIAVLMWAITGPAFRYSDTWQLVINTGTTVVTFLMVFLIQATQNRDSAAIHLKLDELLRAVAKARTGFVGLENLPEDDLAELQGEFAALQEKYADRMKARMEKRGQERNRADDLKGELPAKPKRKAANG
jgi:low affinity Fe/Cu permease